MTENNEPKRPDTIYVAYTEVYTPPEGGVEKFDFLISRIGTGKKSLTKYEIGCAIPNVAKCADMTVAEFFALPVFTERNLDGQAAMVQLWRKLMTGPQFETTVDKSAAAVETADPTKPTAPFKDFPLVEGGHAKMQALADGYELGRQATENALEKAKTKKLAAEMETLNAEMEEAGMNIEAIRAMIAKKKKKG